MASTCPRLKFFNLPRELRDEIYSLAYTEPTPVKLVSRDRYIERQKKPHRFRRTDCCRFLISKQFLAEAHEAYLRTNTFHLEDNLEVIPFLSTPAAKHNVASLIFEYRIPLFGEVPPILHAMGFIRKTRPSATPQIPPFRIASVMNKCERLKRVVVEVNWIELKGARIFQDVYFLPCEVRVLEHWKMVKDLKLIRGLESLRFTQRYHGYGHAVPEYREDVRVEMVELEGEVQREVVKAKPREER